MENHQQSIKLINCLPVLKEAENIQQVISRFPGELDGNDLVQYLVVDDGGPDNTTELVFATVAQVISYGRYRGVGAAFQFAVEFALEHEADVLVGIDADGQFDSVEIPALIRPHPELRSGDGGR